MIDFRKYIFDTPWYMSDEAFHKFSMEALFIKNL